MTGRETAPAAASDDGGGVDPRDAVAALTDARTPFLVGVRHHSPALATVLPALLDAAGAQVVCVELPADFQPWLPHLADPDTTAPVALAGVGEDGQLGFYPFADFSPELAAIRWARANGVQVRCCDLPLSDPGWDAGPERRVGPPGTPPGTADAAGTGRRPEAPCTAPPDTRATATDRQAPEPSGRAVAGGAPRRNGTAFADALSGAGTGRVGDDLWDRAVEVLAPGCAPEAVRRAALGVGWALRADASARDGVPAVDLAREAHMRQVLGEAAADGRRVAAVVGAFHAPALLIGPEAAAAGLAEPVSGPVGQDGPGGVDVRRAVSGTTDARGAGAPARTGSRAPTDGQRAAPPHTSLVPYAFALLDARSGYPAGIRDPRWQQAVFAAGGDPERVREAAARAVTGLCRELRSAGHTAGTGEAAETLRLAEDLARLRALPAPGRGEILEAVTTVLGQGETLGRGRALSRALETVMVGGVRGRLAPGTPRSGLGPAVEAELAALRLPCPDNPTSREIRLDPLRSRLDGRREVLLNRLAVCGVHYGEPAPVAGVGDGTGLTTRWRLSWTPAVSARLDLVGVRGVTAALAAAGTLREAARRERAADGPTCQQILTGLRDAARCDLPELVADRLAEAADALPSTATLPELLDALDLTQALRQGHLPGATRHGRRQAADLAVTLLEAAVRGLPGLAGSDDPGDAAALVALATRAGEHRLGLRMDDGLSTLAHTGSPLMRGAALATRVLLDLESAATLGVRVAGWIDTATDPDGRRRLARLLSGLLTAAGPLLQSAPTAVVPLLDRVQQLSDQGFLDRLPALRGGFDTLTPAARDRLLRTVSEHLGDRLDLTLTAPPELLARWTAADSAGLAALTALRLPGAPTTPPAEVGTRPSGAADGPPSSVESVESVESGAASGKWRTAGGPELRRITPADRVRLLLGRETGRLGEESRRYAGALDELYGTGRGEGATDIGPPSGEGADRASSFPTAREWAAELEALFDSDVREEVLATAAQHGRTDVLGQLDPAAVRPSIELLSSVLALAGGLPESQLAALRPLVRRLVDELARELATRLRPALSGVSTPRPTRRPGGPLDLPRTLRANLAHTRRLDDGRTVVVPERPMFKTRTSKEADWRLVLAVDVSGSMEASVIWSALTAAVLAGVPTLGTHFLAFSTEVIDLTEHVSDPLSLLLETRVGGGTHIAAALAHARSLVTVPSRTLVVVVSDFEEGGSLAGLLGEVRALASSGVHLMGCAALDDGGVPRYSVPVAEQLAAAGMPVAALSPQALARWVGERLRGEAR